MRKTNRIGRCFSPVAVACVALAFLATPVFAQDVPAKSSTKFLAAFKDVAAKPSASVARILCEGKEVALGTVVGADGWVLTKASELTGKPECRFKDGRLLQAKVVGVLEKHDLALLKVEATDLIAADLVDSKAAQVGNWVVSVGLNGEAVAVGVVSVGTRSLPARDLRPSPNPTSGYLGVLTAQGEGGVKIDSVTAGSAAAKAGLKANDVVISMGDVHVTDPETLMGFMARTKPGQVLVIKLKRGAEEMELKVTLDKRPATAERSDIQNRMGSELSNRRNGFATFLQHDTVIKPRDCGGPLVDLDGKTVGINIARAGRVESYAIPSELVKMVLPELKSGKLAPERLEAEAKHKAEVEKKVSDARKALEKALADKALAEKNIEAAKKALEQAEAEAKAAKAEKK